MTSSPGLDEERKGEKVKEGEGERDRKGEKEKRREGEKRRDRGRREEVSFLSRWLFLDD